MAEEDGIDEEDLIYHYTDTSGLLGILHSRKLWATGVEFLNDPNELRFGRKAVIDALREIVEAGVSEWKDERGYVYNDETRFEAAQGALNALDFDDRHLVQRSDVFTVSFCVNGDLLSQWRGYGQAQGGFAIGFSRSHLAGLKKVRVLANDAEGRDEDGRLITPGSGDYEIDHVVVPVHYGDGFVPEAVRKTVEALPSREDMGGKYLGLSAYQAALLALAQVKAKAFVEEQEWRIIRSGPTVRQMMHPTLFRERNGMLVSYVEVDYEDRFKAIKRIVVGPGPNAETNLIAATGLAHRYGLWFIVEPSEAELR